MSNLGPGRINRTSCKRRRASSLIEVLLTISMIGALLTMSSHVLIVAGQVHTTAVSVATELRVTEALGHRLRQDARQATQVEIDSSQNLILFSADGQRLQYSLQSETSVAREHSSADGSVGHDRWRFAKPVHWFIELEASLLSVKLMRVDSADHMEPLIEIVTRTGQKFAGASAEEK